MNIPISVVILTYNESVNIVRCLDSIRLSDDIVVLDSHSTDDTCTLAAEKGARIEYRHFDNYARQRNHALQNISYRNDWVLMLDADEMVPDALMAEMAAAIAAAPAEMTLFRLRRKDYFMGSWLKHCTNYSSVWFGRLIRLGHVWVEREINEEFRTVGEVRDLAGALEHYPFNKGIGAWVEKHNRYSSMEAELLPEVSGFFRCLLRMLKAGDPVERRKWLKQIVYSIPGFPLYMWFARYVFCGGVFDGRAGFMFCGLKLFYEYLICCKSKELDRRRRNLPV